MKIYQNLWKDGKWETPLQKFSDADLLLLFFSPKSLKPPLLQEIRSSAPDAFLFGCSTAGEIYKQTVHETSISLTAIDLESTQIQTAKIHLPQFSNSYFAGKKLGTALPPEGLRHVLVLAEGIEINGSELVRGLKESLPDDVMVTGGLAGDDDRFSETEILWNELQAKGSVGAIGFYGENLKIGHASLGGWDPFGPERIITKADKNILYELDGKPALELYKKYLGQHAADLPASALLFPLQLNLQGSQGPVRTILGINEEDGSMTFAGDMPVGARTVLMKANFDRLIEGASQAAHESISIAQSRPELAILISCVGRRLVLKQRTEEEVEAVAAILGGQSALCGFYSYGEISPMLKTNSPCELHNQTMTITTLSE